MSSTYTTGLLSLQPICNSFGVKSFVASHLMGMPDDPGEAGRWTKAERERRAISAAELANRINGLAREAGDPTVVSQQVVSKFEQGQNKRLPSWTRLIGRAFDISDAETKEDPHLTTGLTDGGVEIRRLPNRAGMGGGGTEDDDPGVVVFSRDLIERELRASADALLVIETIGDSMEPKFLGGDQILVNTRDKSLANPGAFCLWDGDGHVIKLLQRIMGSDPPRVRILSQNSVYPAEERLLEEVNLVGRVIWFGRRVQ